MVHAQEQPWAGPSPGRVHCDATTARLARFHLTLSRRSVFEDNLRDRLLGGMRQRERCILDAQPCGELRGSAVKADSRAAARHAHDLAIPPAHAVVPARAPGLHRGLLGGKARRVTLHAICLAVSVADLSPGKNALQKAVPEAL